MYEPNGAPGASLEFDGLVNSLLRLLLIKEERCVGCPDEVVVLFKAE